MYTLELIPSREIAYCYRYESEEDAVEAARKLAEEHKVQVNVSKVIKRFLIKVIEEED